MSSLVIAEHDHQALKAATLHTIKAASQLGEVVVLVAGKNSEAAAKEAADCEGVKKVLHVDDENYAHPLAENMAALVMTVARDYRYILAPSTTFGKNILPRIAALLDVGQVTDVIEIIDENTFKRPIYAGNVIATVKSHDPITLLTVRTTAFDKVGQGGNAAVESLASAGDQGSSRFVKMESSEGEGPELTTARVVLSGGRGLGSGENFKILESLAQKIENCAIGASRAAVDAGYVPNDYQIGQTGKVVAPELYIAVGISGAIQHVAGMKDSKIIVAINKDENAPIFEIADYGLVADLFDVIPKFEQLL